MTLSRYTAPDPQQRQDERNARNAAVMAQVRAQPKRGVSMGGGTAGPVPKENVLKSAAYENAVRDIGRCMRCGYVCRPQFCHRDEGKGGHIKTDVREGWAGCGPHDGTPGCHYFVGTSGKLPKEQRRAEDLRLGRLTRDELRRRGTWPKNVPHWKEGT